MSSAQRVLVTGSSGFVGGVILRRLADTYTVVALSRHAGRAAGESLDHDLSEPGIDSIVRTVDRCDVIVHAAADINMELLNASVVQTNTLGTLNVLALASAWDAYVVYLSSIQVIGLPQTLPVTEAHATAPRTTYHATKLFGEHIIAAAGRDAAALRLTSPVGPGMPHNRILPVFTRRAACGQPLVLAGRGGRRQDYVNVADVADATAACIARRANGVFNIGGGASVSNLELARLCLHTLHSASPITFSGQVDEEEDAAWEVAVEKAHDALGYVPETNLPGVIRALAERNLVG